MRKMGSKLIVATAAVALLATAAGFAGMNEAEAGILGRIRSGISSAAGRVGNWAGRKARGAWSSAGSAGSWVSGKAQSASRFARRYVNRAATWASTQYNRGAAWTQRKYQSTSRWANSKYQSARSWVRRKAAEAVSKAKSAGAWVKKQGNRAVEKAKSAGRWVKKQARRAYKWAKDKLNIIKRYGARVLRRVKRKIVKHLSPLYKKLVGFVKGKIDAVMAAAKKAAPVLKEIEQTIAKARGIIRKIKDPEAYAGLGKEQVVERLTQATMTVVDPLLEKANVWLVGKAMKIVKHPISQAVATTLSTAIASAVASVTAGIGSFLQPVLSPLTKWTADKILDWAIDKSKKGIAKLLFSFVRPMLESRVIRPIVARGYEGMIKLLKSNFPRAFAKGKELLKKAHSGADELDGALATAQKTSRKLRRKLNKHSKKSRSSTRRQSRRSTSQKARAS